MAATVQQGFAGGLGGALWAHRWSSTKAIAPRGGVRRSDYEGVVWHAASAMWLAVATPGGAATGAAAAGSDDGERPSAFRRKVAYLGRFTDERLAAAAYDAARIEAGAAAVNGTTEKEREAAAAAEQPRVPSRMGYGGASSAAPSPTLSVYSSEKLPVPVRRWAAEEEAQAAAAAKAATLTIANPRRTVDAKRPRTASRSRARGGSTGGDSGNRTPVPGTPKTSTFRGVSWNKVTRRWRAQIRIDNKSVGLGHYDEERLAAAAYDAACMRQSREVVNGTTPEERERASAPRAPSRPSASSSYRGVGYDRTRGLWGAHIKINGKQRHLGHFDKEKMAAAAYDAACVREGRDVVNGTSAAEQSAAAEGVRPPQNSRKTSNFRGVTWNATRGQWLATTSIDGKRHRIGYYDTETEAAAAFDEAIVARGRKAMNAPMLKKTKKARSSGGGSSSGGRSKAGTRRRSSSSRRRRGSSATGGAGSVTSRGTSRGEDDDAASEQGAGSGGGSVDGFGESDGNDAGSDEVAGDSGDTGSRPPPKRARSGS